MGRIVTEALPSPRAAGAVRPAFAPARNARFKWWLWPHLLSLDAPLVALVWQDWWGRAVHAPPTLAQRTLLGLGVWLIYLADRLADNARGGPEHDRTARHAFARTYRTPLTALAMLLAVVLTVLAPLTLPADQFRGGLILLAASGAYFWSIHRRFQPRWTRRLPKEAVVGGVFALGTAFFSLCRPAPPTAFTAVAIALFGGVCFLNCALITAWERNPRDRRDPASLLNAFPTLVDGGLRRACWWLAAVAGVAGWGWHTALCAPVLLAAVALATLDAWRQRLPVDVLRCLVDLVLLTPTVCLGAALVFRWVGWLPPL